jgi:ABC-type dipeptide/oligopeptide/nickel transport system permease subunit
VVNLLGTDQAGRDQLARLMDGGSRSLGSALLVLIMVSGVGLVIGLIAGMCGGWFDSVAMRLVDIMMALPGMVMAIAVVGALGPGLINLLVAMVISSWAYYARLTRSYVLTARQRPDVLAARLAGIGTGRIITTHILPGVLTQLIVIITLNLGSMITWISGLSFLGLGVQPPKAEWGAMLSSSRFYFTFAPWLLLGPAVLIFLSVISANLIGNALRDILDPKK